MPMSQNSPAPFSADPTLRWSKSERMLRSLHLWNFTYQFHEFLFQLLRVDFVRTWVSAARYFWLVKVRRKLRVFDLTTGDVALNAVHHNMFGLRKIRRMAVTRSNMLLY